MPDDNDMQAQRALFVRLLHLRHLGLDPANGGVFRENEAVTANALERITGRRFRRAMDGGDWVAAGSNKVYDDCSPKGVAGYRFEAWCAALKRHLITQGIDVITVDLRGKGLTRPQLREVVDFVNALPTVDRKRIKIIADVAE